MRRECLISREAEPHGVKFFVHGKGALAHEVGRHDVSAVFKVPGFGQLSEVVSSAIMSSMDLLSFRAKGMASTI